MTAEWYDLGGRLYAARTGRVVPVLRGSPLPPITHPVAVRATKRGGTVEASIATPSTGPQTRCGESILTTLHDLGATLGSDTWRTLVTDDAGTLPVLDALARSHRLDGPHAGVAAHIGWWSERADFPGTSAVVSTLNACRVRWLTGDTPNAERLAATWRAWLGVTDEATTGLLTLLDLLRDGERLDDLDVIASDDGHEWARARAEHNDGRDWRWRDPIGRAAVGLRGRCDAADLYASALLSDPGCRRRGVHTGHVVQGSFERLDQRHAQLTCPRLDARLRPQGSIVGWEGSADSSTAGGRFAGTVASTAVVGADLVLVLTIPPSTLDKPQHTAVSVMESPTRRDSLSAGRSRMARLYATRTSWLTTGRTPTPQRRDVPIDVMVACAPDND